MDKTIITVATTGTWPNKKDNPFIPYTPREIADNVLVCWEAGAAVAHLHMRNGEGMGTLAVELFAETKELIESRCDIILNMTTAGDRTADDDARVAHIAKLRPEMATIDCGSMNWQNTGVFLNTPVFLEKVAKVQLECGIKPELEVFDAGMLYNSLHLLKIGLLTPPPHYQFVLGVAGGMAATIENLVFLKSLLPEGATWSAFGISKWHLPIMFATIALGGHVRVGLEDNLYYSKKVLATNLSLVERAVRLAREADREAASPAEARALLGLRGK